MNRYPEEHEANCVVAGWAEQASLAAPTLRSGMIAAVAAVYLFAGTGYVFGQETGALPATVGFVYTADEDGNSISAVNLADGRVETVPVVISPHNVQTTADGKRLLAVGEPTVGGEEHGHDRQGHAESVVGRLLVFDPGALASGPLATIEVGDHPAHVVVDKAGSRAFVTLSGQNAVAVVDLDHQQVVRLIATGAYPHGLRLSPDGGTAYVANVEDASVSVLDMMTFTEVARIPVGKAPVQVSFTPDGTRVYVSLRDENIVAVIDTSTKKIVDRIKVGRNPIQVYATPNGRLVFVANQGTEAEPADTVTVIDVSTGSVHGEIRTGAGAHGVVVSDDGQFVFVTNIIDGTVSMIDPHGLFVIRTFAVGSGPNGITFRAGNP